MVLHSFTRLLDSFLHLFTLPLFRWYPSTVTLRLFHLSPHLGPVGALGRWNSFVVSSGRLACRPTIFTHPSRVRLVFFLFAIDAFVGVDPADDPCTTIRSQKSPTQQQQQQQQQQEGRRTLASSPSSRRWCGRTAKNQNTNLRTRNSKDNKNNKRRREDRRTLLPLKTKSSPALTWMGLPLLEVDLRGSLERTCAEATSSISMRACPTTGSMNCSTLHVSEEVREETPHVRRQNAAEVLTGCRWRTSWGSRDEPCRLGGR